MTGAWRIAIYVLIGVVIVAILAYFTRSNGTQKTQTQLVRRLLQQATRFHTIAQQDQNPLISLMHANYAVAYGNVARSVAEKYHLRGSDVAETIYFLEETQQQAMQKINRECPQVKLDGMFAVNTGWL